MFRPAASRFARSLSTKEPAARGNVSRSVRTTKCATSISLAPPVEPKYNESKLLLFISEARRAVAVAKEDGADDFERDASVKLARRAIGQYTERVSALECGGDVQAREAFQEKIGGDVALLKDELFNSRKQRVWMAVSGWF
jgi:hypothetical protein